MIQMIVLINHLSGAKLLLDAKLNIRPRGKENSSVMKNRRAVIPRPSRRYRVTDQNINYTVSFVFLMQSISEKRREKSEKKLNPQADNFNYLSLRRLTATAPSSQGAFCANDNYKPIRQQILLPDKTDNNVNK